MEAPLRGGELENKGRGRQWGMERINVKRGEEEEGKAWGQANGTWENGERPPRTSLSKLQGL